MKKFYVFIVSLVIGIALFNPSNIAIAKSYHYVNVYGNSIHTPVYVQIAPIGASAKCRDGSYSFSQSRRGTCSHHGGVARWI
ncbi:MAG: DUF3761 domain-containing protein [Candidatus Parcubacteria bacterium]|nr:DUF3761 domain-containing protein [Candidatus Parcubacteria bacterium]